MAAELVVIENHFKPLVPRMAEAIPANANLPVKRVMQSIMIACEREYKLRECTAVSLQRAAFTACTLGLLCDGPTGQGFIIPYGSEAQFVTGVKGYGTIAARSGFLLGGNAIYEGERYEIMLGTGGYAKVWPDFSKRQPDKTKIIAAYATLESKMFPPLVDAMGLDEIMRIKARSKTKRADTPWNTDFVEMAKKTVKRRLSKSCPIDLLQLAVALDDAVDQGSPAYIRAEDQALIVDAEVHPVSATQPPPSEAFSLRDQTKWEAIFGDGVTRDLENEENWAYQIRKRLGGGASAPALTAFLDRNREVFDRIAEKHPDTVKRMRLDIREAIDAAAGQSEPAPSDEDAIYRLMTPTGEEKFESEGEYLLRYRAIVAPMFADGKAREMLAFDQANKPLIGAVVGLAEAVAAVNAEIRKPAGGLNV